jgi:hypothetical protein
MEPINYIINENEILQNDELSIPSIFNTIESNYSFSLINNRGFNVTLLLKLNLYNKNHNLLYSYIINKLDEFKSKRYYFNIIENSIISQPELISNNLYLTNFNNITKYLFSVQNDELFIVDKDSSDLDLSLPEKDLIFMLF